MKSKPKKVDGRARLFIRLDAEFAKLIRYLAVDTGKSLEETCERLMREGYEHAKGES